MNSHIRIDLTPELDEDIAEATNADGTLVAQFTPACNRAPAGTAALRVPAEACESMWDELEALHRKTFG